MQESENERREGGEKKTRKQSTTAEMEASERGRVELMGKTADNGDRKEGKAMKGLKKYKNKAATT